MRTYTIQNIPDEHGLWSGYITRLIIDGCQFCSFKVYHFRFLPEELIWCLGPDEWRIKDWFCMNCKKPILLADEQTFIESAVRLSGFSCIENVMSSLGFNLSKKPN